MPKSDKTWSHELEVVGLGFRMKKEARRQLKLLVQKKGSIPGMVVTREPDNKYDANAIKVCLPDRVMHGIHIGYFHRETAELLADRLDAGTLVVKSAVLTSIDGEDDKFATLTVRFEDRK